MEAMHFMSPARLTLQATLGFCAGMTLFYPAYQMVDVAVSLSLVGAYIGIISHNHKARKLGLIPLQKSTTVPCQTL